MNRLAAILPLEQILLDADITSKKRAFEELGFLFENLQGINRSTVTDSLLARERLGSTGLGHGVAIPHGRIKGLKQPHAALLRLKTGIGFDAIDQEPVRILICLLMPESNVQQHLEILSDIAQLLGDKQMREQFKTVMDSKTLFDILQAAP